MRSGLYLSAILSSFVVGAAASPMRWQDAARLHHRPLKVWRRQNVNTATATATATAVAGAGFATATASAPAATSTVDVLIAELQAIPGFNDNNQAATDFCQQGIGRNPGFFLANGTQAAGFNGACSRTPQGEIPSFDNMVSTLIREPDNLQRFAIGQPFDVRIDFANFDVGFFSNPVSTYYSFPQTLNGQGLIQGHQHITIQKVANSLNEQLDAPDANLRFGTEFFKGLELDAERVLFTTVPGLNETGVWRICSITGTLSHQPVVMPVAQRGSQDDCIRVLIGDVPGQVPNDQPVNGDVPPGNGANLIGTATATAIATVTAPAGVGATATLPAIATATATATATA
ncbi:hypothetical protein HK102_002826 [Quaeritorhiza haematococci]|nr:hypothetical protein HK102_002826 [Quaeritorhiza haematococci]